MSRLGRNRREFIRNGLLLAGGAYLTAAHSQSAQAARNWAGNVDFQVDPVEPADIDEVRRIVQSAPRAKALGSGHSFSKAAAPHAGGQLISTKKLNKIVSIDKAGRRVTAQAGIKYGDLGVGIAKESLALRNYASLPHISLGGSAATATHGSGVEHQNLAGNILGLRMIDGRGNDVSVSRDKDGDGFLGAVVAMGALGVVVELTVEAEPAYQVRQEVYLNLSRDALVENLDDVMSAGRSVSCFTDWNEDISELWVKTVATDAPYTPASELFGAKRADRNVHPILAMSAENCSEQLGSPGPSYERLPHFRMAFRPSTSAERHAEYFVPWDAGPKAIESLFGLRKILAPVLQISEIRAVANDSLWMSTANGPEGGKKLALHFTWNDDDAGILAVLPVVEEALKPFSARPHWGKLFVMKADRLRSLYPKFGEFVELAKHYDPDGKFRNEYLDTYIYG